MAEKHSRRKRPMRRCQLGVGVDLVDEDDARGIAMT
jgi:hypothetical protein